MKGNQPSKANVSLPHIHTALLKSQIQLIRSTVKLIVTEVGNLVLQRGENKVYQWSV